MKTSSIEDIRWIKNTLEELKPNVENNSLSKRTKTIILLTINKLDEILRIESNKYNYSPEVSEFDFTLWWLNIFQAHTL